ncbi:MAG: NAD(P)-dependent oxidoreductase, partial [Anaerolineae bacterium]
MPEFKLLITDGLAENGKAVLRGAVTVDDRPGISAADLLTSVADYDALIIKGRTRITPEILDAASRLQVIGRAGVGVDNIDLAAAKAHNVTVVNAPTSTTGAVAELSFGLLLALAREIPRADAAMKSGAWLKKELEGVELNGKTLGVIGYGRIGMEMGKRA